jgi:hypothetical protein
VIGETTVVLLRVSATRGRSRAWRVALAVAAVVAVSIPTVLWRTGNLVGRAPFAHAHREVSCRVFVRPEASQETIARIGETLAARLDVRDLQLITHQMAFEEFKELFAGSPDIVESASPFVLPAQWRFELVLADAESAEILSEQLERDPSVAGRTCEAP